MKLSIIIPVFNGEKYIKKCLDSIVKNIIENCEVIIVNDGSTDNTKKILLEYQRKYNFIKVYNNKNQGVSISRNYGIDISIGEYIMFVDADDFLSLDWNLKVSKALDTKDDFIFFNSQENINLSSKIDLISYMFNKEKNTYLSTPWSKLYKSSIIKKNNIKFEEQLINGEDFIFNLKYFKNINDFKILKNNIYIYRITPNSLTKNFNEKIFDSDKLFIKLLNDEVKSIYQLNPKFIIESEKYNGLYLILNRIFSNNKLEQSVKYSEKIDRNYYNKSGNNLLKLNLSKIQKILINCFHKKKYLVIYMYFKLALLKRTLKNNKEKLIKI